MASTVIQGSVGIGAANVADLRLSFVVNDRAGGVVSCSSKTGEMMATSFFGRRLTAVVQRSCSRRVDPTFSRRYSSFRVRAHLETLGEAEETVEAEETNPLFTPFKIGPYEISHRVVLAPLTRCRSYGRLAQPHAAVYYSQRASPGGLLITEATCISATASGAPSTPDIWSEDQTEAWKPVVKAVHEKGGIFFCQLWHTGRQSGPIYQPNGIKAVSSTDKPVNDGSQLLSPEYKFVPFDAPRRLEIDELPSIINDYVISAKNAIAAGFDGVEVHGANGYLLDQFLKDGVNDRTDEYGGSLENQARVPLQVVDAVIAAVGAERVGIRLSPFTDFGDAKASNPMELGTYMAKELNKRNIAYVHYIEPRMRTDGSVHPEESLWPFRKAFTTEAFIAAGGYGREDGIEAVKSGKADAIAYGRLFISNPDLPRRYLLNAPLNAYNRDTFYIPDPVVGYTGYPFLEESHPEFAESSN
ncbi:unnamed protein product [Calypogeia fissa]